VSGHSLCVLHPKTCQKIRCGVTSALARICKNVGSYGTIRSLFVVYYCAIPKLSEPELNITKSKLQKSWSGFVSNLRPYAATTVQFNHLRFARSGSEKDSRSAILHIKSIVRRLALQIDQRFFNTNHVQDRVASSDRFHAFCVVEKPGTAPHIHMAWYQPSAQERGQSPITLAARSSFLARTLNSDGPPTSNAQPLQTYQSRLAGLDAEDLVDWERRGWSARTEPIYSSGWANYITKEQRRTFDFADQVFFLSDFHRDNQRRKPTRYHTIDRTSGLMTLDLDVELKPRR